MSELLGQIFGPFEIQGLVGQGSMGDVYRALMPSDKNREVALKVMNAESAAKRSMATAFSV